MARMLPGHCPVAKAGAPIVTAERILFERLSRELNSGWTVIHDCAVHAHDNEGTVEFVLINGSYGLALLGIAEPDEEAAPDLAITAMRTMLNEIGFTRRFRGDLAIVARTLRPDETGGLADIVEALFAKRAVSTVNDPTWPEWLVEHLAPAAKTPAAAAAAPRRQQAGIAPVPQLRAPTREDAWRVSGAVGVRPVPVPLPAPGAAASAVDATMHVAPDPLLVSQAARRRPSSLPAMGFAIIVVSLVLTGMALLSHGNGPGPRSVATMPATPSQ